MKYIPGEILSAYIAVNGILASVSQDMDFLRQWVHIVVFVAFLAVTPLYFRLLAGPREPTGVQMGMSTLAFVIWVYNLGGPFTAVYPRIHIPWIGSILLIMFTLISGLVVPRQSD